MQKNQNISEIETVVDSVFVNFQNEIFFETNEIQEESGWIMELPSGKGATRSFLIRQAEKISTYGKEATPFLYKWVMNEELYIRYIAVQALEIITGIQQPVPVFEKEDPGEDRQKAIKIWNEWYEEQKNK